jgi:WD40 repeat protein
MNPDEESNQYNSITRQISAREELQQFNQELLKAEIAPQINHAVSFKKAPVARLHTYDSEHSIFADYQNGSFVREFDVQSGTCLTEDEWNPDPKQIFKAFENCSSYVLTIGGKSGTLRAFDTRNNRSYHAITKHTKGVNDLISSSDPRFIISCADDGLTQLYSRDDWGLIHAFESEPYLSAIAVTSVPLTPFIAVGYSDGSVRIFDIISKELRHEFKILPRPIVSITATNDCVCFAYSDEIIISALDGRFIKNITVDSRISIIRCGLADIISHSPQRLDCEDLNSPFMQNMIFVGLQNGQVLVYHVPTGRYLYCIEGHNECVTSMLLSPKQFIITASTDGAIRRYHYPSRKCVNVYYTADGCRSVSLSGDRKLLCVSGFIDNKIKLVDREGGVVRKEIRFPNSIRCSHFSTVNGKDRLFAGCWDREVKEIDVDTGELVRSIELPGRVCELKLENGLLFIGYYDRNMPAGFLVMDINTGANLFQKEPHLPTSRHGRAILLLPVGEEFISASDDGKIFQWNWRENSMIRCMDCDIAVRSLHLSSDRKRLFVGMDDAALAIWNLENGIMEDKLNNHGGAICAMNASKDILFVGDSDGVITRYDLSTMKRIDKQRYHNDRIWALTVDETGNILVSCSEDGTAAFIDISNGEHLGTYYNIDKGFIWEAPQNEQRQHSHYWTNRLDRVKLYYETDIKKSPDDAARKEYHAVYNSQKVVMGRINNSGYFHLFALSSVSLNQHLSLNGSAQKIVQKYLHD